MSSAMSQKEYLKKYLSGNDSDKKKKKKKREKVSSHNKGMRIIEDSLDLKTVPYGYKEDDDNPTVAEVTYDNPKLKVMEEFEASNKWKKLEKPNDPSTWSHLMPEGKDSLLRSPGRRGRHDSPSPPRKVRGDLVTQRRARHDSGSPLPSKKFRNDSPSPKRGKSDLSPARRARHDSESPPRRFRHDLDSPRRLRHDSDSPPPRKTRSDSDDSPPRTRYSSGSPPMRKTRRDSDSSPTQRRRDSDSSPKRHDFDSLSRQDLSPPRKARHESESPLRRPRHDSDLPPWEARHQCDSPRPNQDKSDPGKKDTENYDVSDDDDEGYTPPYPPPPPTRMRKDSNSSVSDGEKKNGSLPAAAQKQNKHDSSTSPPPARRRRHDSDTSPPRRHDSDPLSGGRKSVSDATSKRNKMPSKRDASYDSDASHSDSLDLPPVKSRRNLKEAKAQSKKKQQETRGTTNTRQADPEPHRSPPRRKQHEGEKGESASSPPRRKRHDSDSSPPRKKTLSSNSPPSQKRYDSDASPPRQKRHDSDSSPVRRKRHSDSDSSPPRSKKGKPGFASPPRRKGEGQGEARPERKMSTQEYLLARKKGRLKKDTPEDLARKEREAALQQEAEEKHQQWKHGVKQVQEYKKKVASDIHEMGKAFTRTADDVDLNAHLKMAARKEDPMLEYLVKKEGKANKMPVKPVYKGSFPPNRLDIRPGYRWDGVDRSSGFEKRWFEHQNNKRAHNEDAYKWSVSDM